MSKAYWKVWWNTPPNESDWFFVNIRKLYQSLFPCKHLWENPRSFIHGEDHGPAVFRRQCKFCGKSQFKVYHRFGDVRCSWHDDVF